MKEIIYKEDAIKAFDTEPFNVGDAEAAVNTYLYACGVIRRIKNLPPAQLESRKGKWIFCEGIKGKDNVEKCSCCQSHWKEAVIYRSDTQEYLRLRLKYCPNCGADMRGEQNG